MDYAGAILLVIVFIVLLKVLKLLENSLQVVRISKEAMVVVRSKDLSDDEKESCVQRHAINLVKLFVILTVSAMLALAIPLGLIWLLDSISFLSFDNVLEITLSVWFLVISTVVISLYFYVLARKK